MEAVNGNIVTAPGVSDPQVPAVVGVSGVNPGSNVAGPLRSSSDNRESAGVVSQAHATLKTTSAEATMPPGSHPTQSSRAEAEAKYNKLLDSILINMDTLEKAVQAASNTKLEVKTAARAMGTSVRELASLAKTLGLIRSPEATELRVKKLQQQQNQHHSQSLTLLKEIRAHQVQQDEMVQKQQREQQQPSQPRRQQQREPESWSGPDEEKTQLSKAPPTQWIEVIKRKPAKERARQPRKRPPAIIVRVGDSTYTEVLKKLKGSSQVKAVSDGIVGLTKTRDGDLLVRTNISNESSSQLLEAIGTAMGDRTTVKELAQYQKVVVQDLDEQADPDEVIEAICRITEAKTEEVKMVLTRESTRGMKWVVVSLQASLANKLIAAGKLRVGYVNCRLRLWKERGRGRCPRCLAHGHTRDTCKGPDRRECCRECGDTGHQAANCNAGEGKRGAFSKTLEEESQAGGRKASADNNTARGQWQGETPQ